MAKVTATKRKGRVEAAGRKYQGKKANEDKKAKRSKKSIVAEAADSSQGASQNLSPSKDQGPLIYHCSSCLFQTPDEDQFIFHNKTEHKYFMFCKHCGKCFINTDALVTHIKGRACSKEEMIFRCGVKDCTSVSSSGQMLVYHLQYCHRCVPFIYCVHCDKRFTLPHCLVLHMQDECPVKEKNKRNPSGHAGETAGAAPVTPKPAPARLPSESHRRGYRGSGTKASTPRKTAARSRGRGKGRPIANSSNSNADGPSRPSKENAKQALRRSGRLARK